MKKDMPTIYHCFPEGKHKVLTLSYDDGREADRRLIGILNQHKIKGTFHINSGLLEVGDRIQKEEIKELYEGHEVATHTFTHPTIARCPMEQVVQQILEDRKELEDIVGYPVRGLSYPNGSYNEKIKEVLPHLGIAYSRVVGSTQHFGMPSDLFAWQATCHHKTNLLKLAEDFLGLHKKQYLYTMYVWGHSYEFDVDNNWELIEQFCSYVGGKEDIWYATNIEIVDYLEALERLRISAKGHLVYNPSALDIWLSVDGEIVQIKSNETKKIF